MKIYLTAIIKIKSEHFNEVKSILDNMVKQTRKETACLQYDLHQGIDDKNVFVFYEIWENQQGLDHHNTQPYIKEFGDIVKEKLQELPQIIKTTLI